LELNLNSIKISTDIVLTLEHIQEIDKNLERNRAKHVILTKERLRSELKMFENEYDPTQYDKTLNEIEVAKQDRAEFEAINQVALFDEYLGNKTTN